MISKESGKFWLYCDYCPEPDLPNEHAFDSFYDAVEFAEKNGWERRRENNEWVNICPECQEGE